MCTPDMACPHTLLAELTKSPPSTRARRDLGSDGPGGTGRTERPDRRRVRQPGGLAGGFRRCRADRGRHRPPVASGTASPLPQLQPLLPRGRQAAASADRRRESWRLWEGAECHVHGGGSSNVGEAPLPKQGVVRPRLISVSAELTHLFSKTESGTFLSAPPWPARTLSESMGKKTNTARSRERVGSIRSTAAPRHALFRARLASLARPPAGAARDPPGAQSAARPRGGRSRLWAETRRAPPLPARLGLPAAVRGPSSGPQRGGAGVPGTRGLSGTSEAAPGALCPPGLGSDPNITRLRQLSA